MPEEAEEEAVEVEAAVDVTEDAEEAIKSLGHI